MAIDHAIEIVKQGFDVIERLESLKQDMPCDTCHGTGEREITIGGYGDPEADVPVVCDECNGSGKAKDSVYDYA